MPNTRTWKMELTSCNHLQNCSRECKEEPCFCRSARECRNARQRTRPKAKLTSYLLHESGAELFYVPTAVSASNRRKAVENEDPVQPEWTELVQPRLRMRALTIPCAYLVVWNFLWRRKEPGFLRVSLSARVNWCFILKGPVFSKIKTSGEGWKFTVCGRTGREDSTPSLSVKSTAKSIRFKMHAIRTKKHQECCLAHMQSFPICAAVRRGTLIFTTKTVRTGTSDQTRTWARYILLFLFFHNIRRSVCNYTMFQS